MEKILCVTGKPSSAISIARILSGDQFKTTNNDNIENHDFKYQFNEKEADIIMTSVNGHLNKLDLGVLCP